MNIDARALAAAASIRSLGEDMRRNCLTLREALASDRLDVFVRQEEALGVELINGTDLERALALLITQRRIEDRSSSTLPRE